MENRSQFFSRPRVLDGTSGYCLGGCGRAIISRSGICAKCRTKSCKQCSTQFVWKQIEKDLCADCDASRKKAGRALANTIYGSI